MYCNCCVYNSCTRNKPCEETNSIKVIALLLFRVVLLCSTAEDFCFEREAGTWEQSRRHVHNVKHTARCFWLAQMQSEKLSSLWTSPQDLRKRSKRQQNCGAALKRWPFTSEGASFLPSSHMATVKGVFAVEGTTSQLEGEKCPPTATCRPFLLKWSQSWINTSL